MATQSPGRSNEPRIGSDRRFWGRDPDSGLMRTLRKTRISFPFSNGPQITSRFSRVPRGSVLRTRGVESSRNGTGSEYRTTWHPESSTMAGTREAISGLFLSFAASSKPTENRPSDTAQQNWREEKQESASEFSLVQGLGGQSARHHQKRRSHTWIRRNLTPVNRAFMRSTP
jgi:hypothetical protein